MKYMFQFNNDLDSAKALTSMFADGWTFVSYSQVDGYSWFLLEKGN